ncbi:MAG: hypothetical protein AAB857_03785 [Patescibacteria group bacterium]
MKSKLNFLFFLLAIFGIAVFSQKLNAENIIPKRTIDIKGTVFSDVQEWKLSEKIEEGKKLLKDSPLLKFLEVPKKNSKGKIVKDKKGQQILELSKKEISLAILDTQTGIVFEKRYWLEEDDIKKANSARRNYLENTENLPRFTPESASADFMVTTNWWNNFNSDLTVAKTNFEEGGYVVVANKFLLNNDDLASPEDKNGAKYSDIVYVPYSKDVRDKILIASGKDFMDNSAQRAFQELFQAGVMSRAFPGKLVIDTINPAFVKNILVNEQTDPMLALASADGAKIQAERVLVLYGANKEKSFRYTVSKTGASGPAQIMPTTYSNPKRGTGILQAYIGANLIKDVDMGRVDMVNAIKAQILVFDDHMVYVINRVNNSGSKAKKVFAGLSPDQLDEVRAMIYNGGPNKYNVATGGLNLKAKGAKETLGFVQKLRAIRKLNLFN